MRDLRALKLSIVCLTCDVWCMLPRKMRHRRQLSVDFFSIDSRRHLVVSSARRLRILSSFDLISLHLHQVFELDHDRYQGLALRLRESCTVKIADAKASQHLQVIDLHASRQEVIQTDSEPNVDSFDYLEGSWALNDHRLFNDLAKLLSKLEHILSGHKCNLKHLASLTLVVGNPNVLQQ